MSHDLPGLQGLEGRIRSARGGKENGEGQHATAVQDIAEGVDPEDEGEKIDDGQGKSYQRLGYHSQRLR